MTIRLLRPLVFACVSTLFVHSALGQPQGPPRKYALLIGIDFYLSAGLSTLEYANEDVKALAQELEKHGYNPIHSILDAQTTRATIVGTLYKLSADIREEDTFLIYFAGHGMRSTIGRKATYWMTHAASIEQLDVEGIRLNHLLDYIADIKARQKIVILDHCFSADVIVRPRAASTEPGVSRDGASIIEAQPINSRSGTPIPRFSESLVSSGGTLVIAAARGFAYELPDLKHGVLTAAVLETLQSRKADSSPGDERLSASELSDYVRQRVKALSNNTQEAQIWTPDGVNLGEWIVADKLPLDRTSDVALAVERYKNLFADWRVKNWMTQANFNDGAQMLDKWLTSVTGGRELTPEEAAIIAGVREVADDRTTSAEDRARIIKRAVDAFHGRGI